MWNAKLDSSLPVVEVGGGTSTKALGVEGGGGISKKTEVVGGESGGGTSTKDEVLVVEGG